MRKDQEPVPFLLYGKEASYLTSLRLKIRSALRDITFDSQQVPLLERFRFTYDLRKANPYLGESGQHPDFWKNRGLGYAIYRAITATPDGNLTIPSFGRTSIDKKFLEATRGATDDMVQRDLTSVGFLQSILESYGIDPDRISASDLKSYFTESIQLYCEQGLLGIERSC